MLMENIRDRKDIVRRFLDEAYNKGNLKVGEGLMTADTVMYTPDGDKIKGIEDWKQYAQVFLTALSDINLAIEDIIAEGDTVVARWKASARHSGDLEGIPPSNKQLTLRGVAIYRFEEDKMMELWAYQDRLGLLQQLHKAWT